MRRGEIGRLLAAVPVATAGFCAALALADAAGAILGEPALSGSPMAAFRFALAVIPMALVFGVAAGAVLGLLAAGIGIFRRASARIAAASASVFAAHAAVLTPWTEPLAAAYWGMCGAAALGAAAAILLVTRGNGSHRARLRAFVPLAAALLLHLADRHLFVRLYPKIHDALFLDQLLLGTLACFQVVRRWRRRGILAGWLLAGVGITGWVPAAGLFRSQHAAKKALLMSTAASSKIWRFADARLDGDGDGLGVLLGADCDDADPRVHADRCELPGDGVDANCNGVDAALDGLVAPSLPRAGAQDPPGPVLFLSADALRADAPRDPGAMPALHELSLHATVFRQAYTPVPFTTYSLQAILSGRYPSFDAFRGGWTLERGLRGAGYTVYIACDPAGLRAPGPVLERPLRAFGSKGCKDFDDPHLTSAIAEQAASFLAGVDPRSRTFLWIHLPDPHAPYLRDDGGQEGSARERYAVEVRRVDRAIGRILGALPAPERWLVVVFSDHGEEFGEHGGRFHGSSVYEEQVRVPLVLRGPGQSRAEVVDQPVSLLQLAPTLVVRLGLDGGTFHAPPLPTAGAPGAPPAAPRPVFLFVSTPSAPGGGISYRQVGLRLGRWKLIHTPTLGLYEAYDLEADPREERSRFDRGGAEVSALRDLLGRFEDTFCLSPRGAEAERH